MSTDTRRAFERLHSLLQQLTKANNVLAHGPKRIQTAQKKLAAAHKACEDQKGVIQDRRRAADAASLQLKTSEAEVDKQKLRLNDAKSNKEYEIIQGQISAAKGQVEQLEDSILEMLNGVDEATDTLRQLEQDADDLQTKLQEIQATVAEREPTLNAEVESVTAKIEDAEKSLPSGEATATYRRLKSTLADSAFSRVEGNYCETCNSQITPQDSVKLNLGEFQLCRSCGRILYRPISDD